MPFHARLPVAQCEHNITHSGHHLLGKHCKVDILIITSERLSLNRNWILDLFIYFLAPILAALQLVLNHSVLLVWNTSNPTWSIMWSGIFLECLVQEIDKRNIFLSLVQHFLPQILVWFNLKELTLYKKLIKVLSLIIIAKCKVFLNSVKPLCAFWFELIRSVMCPLFGVARFYEQMLHLTLHITFKHIL